MDSKIYVSSFLLGMLISQTLLLGSVALCQPLSLGSTITMAGKVFPDDLVKIRV